MRLLICGYMFLVVYRPFEYWTSLAEFRLELWYSLLVAGAWVVHGDKRVEWSGLLGSVALFFLAILAAWLGSPWVEHGYHTVYRCVPFFVFFLVVSTIAWSERDLKVLLGCFLGVVFVYMLHSFVEYLNGRLMHRMGIARLVGIDEAYGDPNSFAASIVYALALVSALWSASASSAARLFAVAFGVLGVACVVLTGSRAGFLSLLILFALVVLQSRTKGLLLALGVAAGVLGLLVVSDQLQNRFMTIFDPDTGPHSARVSAEGRWHGLVVGLATWGDYFLTGCGPGCWRLATGLEVEAHNLYGQLGAELGLFGVVSFALFLGAYWRTLRSLRVDGGAGMTGADARFLLSLRGSLAMLVILLLVNGMSGHNLYRYTWLWSASFLCAARQVARRGEASHEPAQSAGLHRWALRTSPSG